jgi:hypothetical protein
MPFGQRQPVQRLSDHDAGVRHEAVDPAEAFCERGDGACCGFLLAHIAVDQDEVARSRRVMAGKATVAKIDNADAPA